MTITVNVTKSTHGNSWEVAAYFDGFPNVEGLAQASSPHSREEDFAASPLFDSMVAEAFGKARDKMVAEVRAERQREEAAS